MTGRLRMGNRGLEFKDAKEADVSCSLSRAEDVSSSLTHSYASITTNHTSSHFHLIRLCIL